MLAARPQHRGKLPVSYGWAEPVTRKRSAQSSCFQTLIKYFKLYCRHSSMMGLKYLVQDRATLTARILWVVTHGFTIWMVYTYVFVIYREYTNTPITTTPKLDYFPTEYVEFPGVAICSVNRISRRKANSLANDVYDSKITNFTIDEILSAIRTLGHLYYPYFVEDNKATVINEILTKYYGAQYDITMIMRELTPDCTDLLVNCIFHDVKKNCMQYFEVRETQDGFCCTFNYFPNYRLKQKSHKKVEFATHWGWQYGLSVDLNPMLDDYFYSILPITGFKVMVFYPYNYPDVSSGSMSEFLLEPETQKYVKLQVDEQTGVHESYSKSGCILICKMQDIWQFCKCKPFFYPQHTSELGFNRTCTIKDIPCLRKYIGMGRYIVPFWDDTLVHLVTKNRTVFCNTCYPECDNLIYKVTNNVNSFNFQHHSGPYDENFRKYTTLNMFFTQGISLVLKQRKSYEWYDYLSDVGGICAFFLGCSIVSLVEIIYYFFLFLMELLMPTSESETEKVKILRKKLPIQSLYLNELIPRPKIPEDFERYWTPH